MTDLDDMAGEIERRTRGEYGPWHYAAALLAISLSSGGTTTIWHSLGIPTQDDIRIAVEQGIEDHKEDCAKMHASLVEKIRRLEDFQDTHSEQSQIDVYRRLRERDAR